jgi:hypothetical protein
MWSDHKGQDREHHGFAGSTAGKKSTSGLPGHHFMKVERREKMNRIKKGKARSDGRSFQAAPTGWGRPACDGHQTTRVAD